MAIIKVPGYEDRYAYELLSTAVVDRVRQELYDVHADGSVFRVLVYLPETVSHTLVEESKGLLGLFPVINRKQHNFEYLLHGQWYKSKNHPVTGDDKPPAVYRRIG